VMTIKKPTDSSAKSVPLPCTEPVKAVYLVLCHKYLVLFMQRIAALPHDRAQPLCKIHRQSAL
jgi:hypothetical protein